jgi:hypothetical protein
MATSYLWIWGSLGDPVRGAGGSARTRAGAWP